MVDSSKSLGIVLKDVSAIFHHPERGDMQAVRDVTLEVRPGELLTLLGPSGCGKTTTLRMVAGFQSPSAGRIVIGERDVTHVAANKRDIGFVFQNYALFPHLSVFENVAYGLRVRGKGASEIGESVRSVLSLVGLAGYGDRSPAELSGGQQQRVALARAIVIQPRVLLFDEPLSNLDAKLRVEMRSEIQKLQKKLGITTLYVTHDQEEAMAISDRIAVMRDGRIAQLGTASDLYRRPASAFVAGFLGRANILDATVKNAQSGIVEIEIAGQRVFVSTPDAYPIGTKLAAILRPEALSISSKGAVFAGPIESQVYLGDKVEYTVRVDGTPVQVMLANPAEDQIFRVGDEVSVIIPSDAVRLVAAEQG